MKVVDASVVVDLVTGAVGVELLRDDELAAPYLIDTEVVNALRNMVLQDRLTVQEGTDALDAFLALTFTRFSAEGLRSRMWALRHNLTASDATYVALAEMLDATLITGDERQAAAPGITCGVELL